MGMAPAVNRRLRAIEEALFRLRRTYQLIQALQWQRTTCNNARIHADVREREPDERLRTDAKAAVGQRWATRMQPTQCFQKHDAFSET